MIVGKMIRRKHEMREYIKLDNDFLEERIKFYFKKFGGEEYVENVYKNEDLEEDFKGVDIIVKLKNGKNIYIDDKLIKKHYDNICLEIYSRVETKAVGYIENFKHITDYVAYWKAKDQCILLDYLTLRMTLIKNRKSWLKYKAKQDSQSTDEKTGLQWTSIVFNIPDEIFFEAYKNAIIDNF